MQSIYLSEEHHQFRDTVRQFFQTEVDAITWEAEQAIPREFWKKMGELGFLGINFPEAYGGAEADMFYSAIFLEELGRTGLGGLAAAVGVQEYVATAHIARYGSEALKQKYLAGSIRGELIGALAVSEPNAGSDVSAIKTRARRDGDFYVINGSKTFITNGVYGDFVTTAVKTGDGEGTSDISLIVIDQGTPGFTANKLKKMGWHCSDTGELSFEDVRVPASNLIGQEGMGFYYIMEGFQLERLIAALTAVGGTEGCLEETLEYMKQRKAFGRPLARFQVLRHRMADMATELEACRQLTYHATWLHQQGQSAVRECSMVKLKACELNKEVVDTCLQCYGGYGYMEEYPIARYYRDTRVGTIAGGTSEIMREILAKMIVDGVTFSAPSQTDKAEDNAAQTEGELPTVAAIFSGLSERFKGDATMQGTIFFDFSQDDNGAFTVVLADGACNVSEGKTGEPDCTVTAGGEVYRDIELGRKSPEAAFMSGEIFVDNIPVMMQFMHGFHKLEPT
ncbi:MAG: acyl-CoA dehydrogenase family protein [Acidobacteriota bacterium]|nr:acyl-CoA dehydrogenase family protein [Acidobacteriota bacterium]